VPLPRELPVVDHHCHLSPNGEGVRAAARFRAAGGTHLFLATQNYSAEPPAHLAAYREQFATTLGLAEAIERETGLRVYPVLAPYPVDLLGQVERLGLRPAVDLHRAALELAGQFVEEQRAVALGEVGRPHFAVPAPLVEPVEEVLRYAFEIARDVHCPIVLHAEELTAEGFQRLAAFAAAASLPPDRVIKHYHRTVLPKVEYVGIVPSYLARRELVAAALPTDPPWFLETDFLDDPARPGAVLDLATVPKRAQSLVDRDPGAIERLRIPFEESVRAVYGFRPEVDGGRPR
jgi:TatD-related deoxyribonuclease